MVDCIRSHRESSTSVAQWLLDAVRTAEGLEDVDAPIHAKMLYRDIADVAKAAGS